MLILFRHNAKKYAYDTVCGSLSTLTALEYRMLEAIEPPMEPLCPTALRYELAKFDSADVEECYEALYKKAANGMIFTPENGTLRPPEADAETVCAAIRAAAERLTAPVLLVGSQCELAREILTANRLVREKKT